MTVTNKEKVIEAARLAAENASFGLTNCAERTAIFKAVSEGHRDFECLAVYGDTKEPISPAVHVAK